MLGVLAVAVALGAGLVVIRGGAGTASGDDALARFRDAADGSVPASGGAADPGPLPGVYPAEGTGTESVGFGPLDEEVGATVPVTVRPADGECWDVRADLNTLHWRSWELCVRDGALVLAGGETSTRRDVPGIDYDTSTVVTCAPALGLSEPDGSVATPGSTTCIGVTGTDGSRTTDEVTAAAPVPDTVEVAGRRVPTVHVRFDGRLTGHQTGTEAIELWVDPTTWLPLRIRFETRVSAPTPFGDLPYSDVGTVTLTSTEPRT